jgi:hypothetical protein
MSLDRLNPFRNNRPAATPLVVAIGDRMGRVLQPGDVCHVHMNTQVLFQLQDVTPMLDANVPPGTVKARFLGTVTLAVPGGQSLQDVLLVSRPAPQVVTTEAQNGQAPAEPEETPSDPDAPTIVIE